MSLEDRALERLMEGPPLDDEPVVMTDAEHRRAFGWGWDDPDHEDAEPDILWGQA